MASPGGDDDSGFEDQFRAEALKEASPLVREVASSLNSALVYADPSNVDVNRKLWDQYAASWTPEQPWVKKMAASLPCTRDLHCVGDEWSDVRSLEEVLTAFVQPFIGDASDVAEIGSGGGRVAVRVAPRCASYACFDISLEMLKKARDALSELSNVRFCHMMAPSVSERHFAAYDFVVCFDCMVHMDLHTMWRYFGIIRRMLKPGGRAFVSTANLLAPAGWDRFSKQSKFTVGGFYFVSPDMVRHLVAHAGLRIVKEAEQREDNIYYNRDFLILLEAPADGGTTAEAKD